MSAITQNPVIVTAPMATSYKTQMVAAGLGAFQTVRIKQIRWIGSASGNIYIIAQPLNEGIIAQDVSNGSPTPIDWDAIPRQYNDFIVTTLTGGTLLIYLA